MHDRCTSNLEQQCGSKLEDDDIGTSKIEQHHICTANIGTSKIEQDHICTSDIGTSKIEQHHICTTNLEQESTSNLEQPDVLLCVAPDVAQPLPPAALQQGSVPCNEQFQPPNVDVEGALVEQMEKALLEGHAKPLSPPVNSVETRVDVEETHWNAYVDDDTGEVYYFNPLTQQTEWDLPPGGIVVEEEEEDTRS